MRGLWKVGAATTCAVALSAFFLAIGAMPERAQAGAPAPPPPPSPAPSVSSPPTYFDTAVASQSACANNAVFALERLSRAADVPARNSGPAVWAAPCGTIGDIDDEGGVNGHDFDAVGGAAGLDLMIVGDMLAGLFVGYADSETDVDNENSRLRTDSYFGGVYAGGTWGAGALGEGFLDALLTAGYQDHDSRRSLTPVGGAGHASADYDGYTLGGRLTLGSRMPLDSIELTPSLGLDVVSVHTDDFTENGGGGANQIVEDETTTSVRGSIGLALSRTFQADDTVIMPEARARYVRELNDDSQQLSVATTGAPGTVSRLNSPEVDRDSVSLGAGLGVRVTPRFGLRLDYSALLNADQTIHGLWAGGRLSW